MTGFLRNTKPYWLLSLLGCLFFIPFLGEFHLFDWDEINFAESSREMLLTGDFFKVQVNYEPFQEKPPMFFWLQSLAMHFFGVSEFSARLPNAIFGILSLSILFSVGKHLKNELFGWIWALVYLCSLLPHFYYKSGIIDPVFNLFIFLGIYFFIRWINALDGKKVLFSCCSGLFIGLAIITKGPVGLLLMLLTVLVFWLIGRFKSLFAFREFIVFISALSFVSLFWFGYETFQNGPWFLVEFIKYQLELFSEPVAGHQQPIYYHFVVVLIGCFPMSIIAFPRFFRSSETEIFSFEKWMKILFWVVLILFTIVSTKIVHYSSMSYLPISYLAALELYSLKKPSRWMLFSLLLVGFMLSAVLFLIPFLGQFYVNDLKTLVDDVFVKAALSSEIKWGGFEHYIALIYLFSVFIFIYLYFRKQLILGLSVLVIGLGSTLLLTGKFTLPKVEQFSQRPAIDFYKSISAEDCYITTVGFKSYAHYYYGAVSPLGNDDVLKSLRFNFKDQIMTKHTVFNQQARKEYNLKILDWYKNGNIDKTVYFVSRVDRKHHLDRNQNIDFLYTKGGFVFYKRTSNN